MSILTEKLPDYFLICGAKCPIRSDFHTWLEVSALFERLEEDHTLIVDIFKLIFIEKLPPSLQEAITKILEFYSHSKETGKKTDEESETPKKSFDFEYDADLIYASFWQQYHIDLVDSTMHWWKFKALLNGLTEDTQFAKVIQYRTVELSRIKDKEQKRFYARMKAMHKLPDNRSDEQKENSLNKALESMF